MRLFYNTNGFAHHRLHDALAILADLGYDGVSLTLDVHHADVTDPAFDAEVLAREFARHRLAVVIETGGRFILDPRRKHRPNLLDAGGAGRERAAFYRRAIEVAERLGAGVVSLWSGVLPEDVSAEQAWPRLVDHLGALTAFARTRGTCLAIEPEPGMLVDTLADAARLRATVGLADLGITCDLGHLHVNEAPPYPDLIARHADGLVNVHVDDIAGRRHEHLELGAGEIDFPPLFAALGQAGYRGPISAELSRSSHRAVEAAAATIARLNELASPWRHRTMPAPR